MADLDVGMRTEARANVPLYAPASGGVSGTRAGLRQYHPYAFPRIVGLSRRYYMHIALMAIALLALAATLPSQTRAQTPALEGSYVLASQGSADINRAIETAIARMNFVTRPIARGRLRKTNIPYGRLHLTITPSEISTIADGGNPVVSPPTGTFVKWRREDGETFDVSTRWQGESLAQTFRADDGQRDNVYTLGEDGRTLTLAVTLSSPRLSAPVKYLLTYRKE